MSTEIKPGDCHCSECAAHYPTPAQIDPHAVKPGDTVTVRFIETGDEITTKAYRPEDIKAGRWVSVLGWPLVKADGTFGLAVKYFELLAHQPAPEPEPEWEMTQVAVVTPHGKDDLTTRAIYGEDGNWHNAYGGFWSDDEVSVRPLVVIDPAAVDVDALVEVAHHDRVLYGDTTPDQMRRAILRILAHMGIEATS